MGYMGLSHWGESDDAAGFRFTLQKEFEKHKKPADLKKAVRALVMKELKEDGGSYNTDGPVNVALVMEDEGVVSEPFEEGDPEDKTPEFSKLLSKKEFQAILKGLDRLIKSCGPKDKQCENVRWHCENYERMRMVVIRKTYKGQ